MKMRELACPNCGANIDVTNSKAAYCQFCGSKIVNMEKCEAIEKHHEQSIVHFKFGRYKQCLEAIYKARLHEDNHSDYYLMEAMIKQDHTILRKVNKDELSKEVIVLGKELLDQMKVNIKYYLGPEDLSKIKLWDVDECPVHKIDVLSMEDTMRYFAFAEMVLPKAQYEVCRNTLIRDNETYYFQFMNRYNAWKRKFKTRCYITMAMITTALILVFANSEEAWAWITGVSIVLIAVWIYSKRS